MSTNNIGPLSELRVAKAPIDVALTVAGTALVSAFLVLAAHNLLNGVAVVPSTLWVGIIVWGLAGSVRQYGVIGCLLRILEGFSRTQVFVVRTVDCSVRLDVGFRLLGLNMIQQRVPASDLVSLSWNTGQASDMAGRDVNDWSVALWYSHHDVRKTERERQHHFRRPGQIPLIIGPPRAKVVTEALGRQVLGFLQDAGISVTLEETDRRPAD